MRIESSRVHDVAVVGGGVAGLSLTRALTREGADVVLVEKSAPGSPLGGASALPAALLNPWRGRKGAAHPDDLRGLATAWRWSEEMRAEGLEPGAHRSGVVRIAGSARQARDWRQRAAAEPSLRWLDPGALGEPYHAPFGALRVLDGGRVDAPGWLASLAASARAHGATSLHRSEVRALAQRPDAVWELRLVAGERASGDRSAEQRAHERRADGLRADDRQANGDAVVRARVVASCVGADVAPDAIGVDGRQIAWPERIRTRGEVVTLTGGPALPWPVAGGVYGAADRGTAWIGGGHRPPDQADRSAPERLRAAFAWYAPAVAHADVAAVWSGVRAKVPNARPEVRRLAPGLWSFGAFAGRGFLCAADEAERWASRWRSAALEPDPSAP